MTNCIHNFTKNWGYNPCSRHFSPKSNYHGVLVHNPLIWCTMVYWNHTVDGSEIPFPTTVWMYKTLQIMGIFTISTGVLARFLPSTVTPTDHSRSWNNRSSELQHDVHKENAAPTDRCRPENRGWRFNSKIQAAMKIMSIAVSGSPNRW